MKNILLICICIVTASAVFSQTKIIDGVVEKTILKDRQVLKYPPLREADVFWEKRIWRIIDVREKMNHHFIYPNAPFFDILKNAAMNGELTLYSAHDDKFSKAIDNYEGIFFERDTVEVVDENYDVTYVPIMNEFGYEDIKRFRIKEVWYFDENTSTIKVRILGIAPLKDIFDKNGNFRNEKPLFWVYYPELRNVIARQEVYLSGNDNQVMSWEDLFEMRYFASVIYKEGNIYDRRIKDYMEGIDRLFEADKIKQELFNFEHDLWSY